VIDFVAVDSNVREPGDYYPVVNRPGSSTGTGEYRIEPSLSGSCSPTSAAAET